ncbi:MAG: CZB domain-containing protein [Candidatus Thiodiazotropha sp.]
MSASAFFLLRMNDHIQYLGKIKAALEDRGDFQGTDHHSCKLGSWMDREGAEQSASLGSEVQTLFQQLQQPHEKFHTASHQALACKAQGDHAGMEAAMTEMFRLSNTLVSLLMQLDTLSQS